ncbi:MAG: NfeD family protein [Nocardioidaceae bacterium]|nr:NfeD family protein [Nocardioidaceae bacterium]NUS49848.1 NfeD family protein [Nocardioidaceae bacterium]
MQVPDGFEAWMAWLGLAVALGVLELVSLDLILLMLAAGAVVGMVAALLDFGVGVQVIAAVAASIAALGLVRPNMVKRLHSGPDLVLGHDALVGETGVVVQQVTPQGGQIRIHGELWTARPYDDDSVIEPGARVDILQIKGATALVHKIPELEP